MMPTHHGGRRAAFSAPDGTELAYRELGAGDPVVCVPGGPMQDSEYLGDLGGLSARHRLIRLDLRGTGASAIPEDTTSYRCDRLVGDVEALRAHLGLDRMNLLGHSGGANLVVLYAAQHPGRVGRLLLITPGLAAVGIDVSAADRREVADLREDEVWFPPASAALKALAVYAEPTPDRLGDVTCWYAGLAPTLCRTPRLRSPRRRESRSSRWRSSSDRGRGGPAIRRYRATGEGDRGDGFGGGRRGTRP